MKTIMHVVAVADSSANSPGVWVYLVVLAGAAAGYMGVPFVGTAAIGAAAVFASQGELNIAAVLIVAVIGNEIGGLLGYKIGDRWGRRILEHPGPALEWRKKTLAKGESLYQKWGRLAVFFTPALVSGTLRMKFGQFAFWNFFAGAVFVLSVGPAAYGAGSWPRPGMSRSPSALTRRQVRSRRGQQCRERLGRHARGRCIGADDFHVVGGVSLEGRDRAFGIIRAAG